MEITLIAIALSMAAGLIYGGLKLNAYSEEKYNYEPINLLTILAMTIPYILVFISFVFLEVVLLMLASNTRRVCLEA
ncbi:MAG: hypothetical protein Q8N01_01680 [Sulfuricurvum sp.]|nr:hypothetical protein [Sulfuricurvum sp.]MDP3023784.1 hypothetical protein [Sulfuricurvum sp.]MDP3119116.1 hypothetical protein [Sulfuricurvum sp.]